MDLHGLMDNMKLKIASKKIAEGIREIKALGIQKEQVIEGLRRQAEHEFRERKHHYECAECGDTWYAPEGERICPNCESDAIEDLTETKEASE